MLRLNIPLHIANFIRHPERFGRIVQKIAIYGKGGSGKSTISAALSVTFAMSGKKVLHVGCDPKADSTFTVTGGKRIKTLLDLLGEGHLRPSPEEFVVEGRFGIDCIEAGGPKPGAGCGGRGIARMFELLDEIGLLRERDYDVVIFDVLGDVVCGGFAAPLRLGFADRAFIVVSEEPLSIYAANNIAHAIDTYSANGVRLGGLILNVSDDLEAVAMVESFATAIGSSVTGVIPRDKQIQRIERDHRTAAELPDDSSTLAAIRRLADKILSSFNEDFSLPVPLSVEELFQLLSPGGSDGAGKAAGSAEAKNDIPPEPMEELQAVVAPEPSRETARVLPEGRTVRGGAASAAALSRLLGLESGKVKRFLLEVTDVTFARDRLLVTIAGPSLAPMTFEFKHRDEGAGYGEVNDLSISHTTHLTKQNQPLIDRLVERARKSGLEYEHLTTLLARDPEAEVDVSEEERKDLVRSQVGFSARHWSVWGAEGTQGVFVYEHERARQVQGELRLGDGAIRVHHGTEACQASEEDVNVHATHFVRFPWRLHGSRKDRDEGADQYLTNIRDYELIAGSNQSLHEALTTVLDSGAEAPVVIDISCTPVISGEDWLGTVDRFKAHYPGTVVSSAVGGTDLSQALVEAGRQALAQGTWTGPGQGLNLVGFPRTRSSDECVALLERAGVEVRHRVFPELSLGALRQHGIAAAQLLWSQAEYEPIYKELFADLPMPTEYVAPPFGMKGVEEMVRQAALLTGCDGEQALAKLEEEFNICSRQLKSLRKRASQHRVGIALTARQADLLDEPSAMCGVPLAAFLEELGFKVEVLHDSQDEGRLKWWLGSGLALVYSDLSTDRRLQGAGLPHFALADLEAGLEGAVRTARRLLRLANATFFSNYGRFVGRG
jgi:nitrogenase iron protein NifH